MGSFVRRAFGALAGAFASVSLLTLTPNPAAATTHPGAIPATFNVGDQGAAAYTIPIDAPVATGGIKPSVALTYNHLAGNGLAGVGWNLAGISSITRCEKTFAVDGQARRFKYTNADQYCLDGQRLVAYSGTYGASGTEYRTEIETFVRVFQNGAIGSTGASSFYVQLGDGRTAYYGYTSDSQVEKVGSSAVRAWYLSYVEDQAGNRIAYAYSENTSTGEVLPTEITWTSNPGQSLSAKYKIAITYETRPSDDQRSGYDVGGAAWAKTKRIDKIDVIYNGSTTIATYDLTYTTPSSTGTGRSQLSQVMLCRGSDCLPATAFTVQNGTRSWNAIDDSGKSTGSNPLVGDFNGDGRQDFFVALSGYWQVYRGRTDGDFESALNSGVAASNPQYARVFDYNGDSLADLLYESSGALRVLLSTGSGFTDGGEAYPYAFDMEFVDYDGDGLQEPLGFRNTGGDFDWPDLYEYSFTWEQLIMDPNWPKPDFNGDGRSDVLVLLPWCYNPFPPPYPPVCSYNLGVLYSLVDQDAEGVLTSNDPGAYNWQCIRAADFNGDGLDDFAYVDNGTNTWWLKHSHGDTINTTAINTGITSAYCEKVQFVDYDLDGRGDLLRPDGHYWYIHRSDGSAPATSATEYVYSPYAYLGGIVADITGDGYPEIITAAGGSTWQVHTHKSAQPDVVTAFTDGLGYAVNVTYASLSQTLGSHYGLGGGTPYPYVRRFAGPRYVVTAETHSNGLASGDTTRELYHYYDTAYVDFSGRGWQSFNWHVVVDSDQGTNTATWFNQTWPYAGHVEKAQLRRNSDSQVIREVDPELNKVTWTTTPNRHFVYADSTTTKEWEVGGTYNGLHLRTIVDNPTYTTGAYNEVYVSSTTQTITDPSTSETWTSVTSFDRSTDADDWCIGLPGLVTTTKTLPTATYAVRKLRHYWDTSTCRLYETRDESESSTAKQLKTTITYDAYGNEDVVTLDSVDGSAADRVTDTDYADGGHYPSSVTVGTVNLTTTQTWDYLAGKPASRTDASGLTTSWTYDPFGRVASETAPGRTSTVTYVAYSGGWPASRSAFYVRTQGSDGSDAYRFFDKLQREIGTQSRLPHGAWQSQYQLYNATGQVATASRPFKDSETEFTTSITYDLIGRVTQQNAPISESTTSGAYTTYTYNGHEVLVTDPENHTTKTVYNAAGEIKQVTDAANGTAYYTYKPFGELATLTDAESNVTTLGYDDRGNKHSMSDPNMGAWSYDYNAFGELASQTNALSETTTLAYDQAGRLTSRSEPEGTTTWAYYTSGTGAKGQVYTISGPGHSMLYQYSSTYGAPTLVRRTFDSASYDFEMSYDAYGRLDVLTYPTSSSGYRFKVDYDYDIYGHLVYAKDGNTSAAFYDLYSTDASGRELQVTLGNGLNEYRDYDRAAGYLKSIEAGPSSSIQDLSFTWDKVGNLLTRTNANIGKTETFTYDALDRLSTMQVSGGSAISLSYSAAGRITYRSDLGNYSYSGVNAGPHAVTSVNGVSYAYDANGRMTSRGGSAITWYSYDLAKKVESGSQSTEFWYGVDRQRYKQVQKTSGTTDATILYLGTLMEIETRGGTTTYRHYVQVRDRVVARVERVSTTNTTTYLHRDHQSSVVEVTDASGNLVDSLAFDAWGLRRDASNWSALGSPFGGTQATERGYTGHEHLDTVGLVNMNGRIQDPMIGRFLSADPLVQAPFYTQSHNRYSYVWNNPLRYTDPSGFCGEDGVGEGGCPDEIIVRATRLSPELSPIFGFFSDEWWDQFFRERDAAYAELAALEQLHDGVYVGGRRSNRSETPQGGGGSHAIGPIENSFTSLLLADVPIVSRTLELFEAATAEVIGLVSGQPQGLLTGTVPTDEARQTVAVIEVVAGGAGTVKTLTSKAVTGLTTPSKYFGQRTTQQVRDALEAKFGPPRSSRPGADTYYNPRTQRSYNVHTDPAHGPPHVDVRRRGPYPDRQYPTGGGGS